MAPLVLRLGFWLPLAVCTWFALVPDPPQPIEGLTDIHLHAGAFAYLTFALALSRAEPAVRPRQYLIQAGCMLGYGLFLEAAQSFTGRSPELKDILVDLVGIAAGQLAWLTTGATVRRVAWKLLAAAPAGGSNR